MRDLIKINVPFRDKECRLKAGDLIEMSGKIYCGRDAVLPYVVELAKKGSYRSMVLNWTGL